MRRARSAADAGAVPALAAALDAEAVPRVREAIMTAFMRVGEQSERQGAVALPALAGRVAPQRRHRDACNHCRTPFRHS